MEQIDRLPERIRKRLTVTETGCWLWTGYVNEDGYGRVGWDGRVQRVHRVVYTLLRGPIDEETLDHLCRTRRCANPDHVRELSNRENILAGVAPPAQNAQKIACVRGHSDGWYERLGRYGRMRRECRTCRAVRKSEATT